jgi:hypothetical protein
VRPHGERQHAEFAAVGPVPVHEVRPAAAGQAVMTAPGGTGVDATGRSTGRRRRQPHTKIAGQFAPRLIEMLESYPYRVLSGPAHRILARLEIEHGHHGGCENGNLPVTFQNFVDYGMDRHSIAPAIRECVALGFVEITKHGSAGNREFRAPNLFRLTYVPTKEAAPTNDWRKIETMEGAQVLAVAARKASAPRKPPRVRKLLVVK